MALPQMPPPRLIALRSVATLVISLLIAQAGWAAAFLGGDTGYRRHHEVMAGITLAVCVAAAVVYVALRRTAGPVNVGLAVAVAVAASVQYGLGVAGSTSLHIFLGVLLVGLGTALTSWTYRHRPPEPAAT
ncbi:hypothetical protein TESS_TESS_02702 [Tessaracoccus sp. O5.2]|uniref:hypothetical protein n=1 Tax=Tessaracoccus sp. O5.2 TaxID=3157622 RepID=UPI0035E5D921